jgi:hypothetical protein
VDEIMKMGTQYRKSPCLNLPNIYEPLPPAPVMPEEPQSKPIAALLPPISSNNIVMAPPPLPPVVLNDTNNTNITDNVPADVNINTTNNNSTVAVTAPKENVEEPMQIEEPKFDLTAPVTLDSSISTEYTDSKLSNNNNEQKSTINRKFKQMKSKNQKPSGDKSPNLQPEIMQFQALQPQSFTAVELNSDAVDNTCNSILQYSEYTYELPTYEDFRSKKIKKANKHKEFRKLHKNKKLLKLLQRHFQEDSKSTSNKNAEEATTMVKPPKTYYVAEIKKLEMPQQQQQLQQAHAQNLNLLNNYTQAYNNNMSGLFDMNNLNNLLAAQQNAAKQQQQLYPTQFLNHIPSFYQQAQAQQQQPQPAQQQQQQQVPANNGKFKDKGNELNPICLD